MELHQLEQFLELAKYQHVSMTADILNISQPALSKSISRLEQELGVKLFDRVGHSITLNQYGEQFANYASQSLQMLKRGVNTTQSMHYEMAGHISIRIYIYASQILPCVEAYSRLNPHVTFQLIGTDSVSTNTLDQNSWDFILCAHQGGQFTSSEQFWMPRKLFQERQYLVVSSAHISSEMASGQVSLSKFRDLPFVVRSQNDIFFQDPTYRLCYQAGFTPRVYCSTDDFLTRLKLIRSGLAISLMDESCMEDALTFAPELRFLDFEEAASPRTISMMRKKKANMSEAALDFWDFVLDYYQAGEDMED